MALIQEKVHRIFFSKEEKTTALAALLCRTVVLLYLITGRPAQYR